MGLLSSKTWSAWTDWSEGLFLHSMILESDVNSRPLLDGIHFENIRFILAMQDPQAVGQKSSW